MNNLPPVPPQDSGFQLNAPVEINAAASPPKFRLKKLFFFLRKFWWIPLITLILALGAAVEDFKSLPPQFVSTASMVESAKLQLPDGASFEEDQLTYFGTMTAILQSGTLRQMALAAMAASGTNKIILGKDGNPIEVQIRVYNAPGSLVFGVQAVSSNPAFTPAYLNALLNAYLDYKRASRQDVSGQTLANISAAITSLGQQMDADQAVLTHYEQSNNLVVLEEDSEVAGKYLASLKTQLADLQLQSNLLDAVAMDKGRILTMENTNMANPLFAQFEGNSSASSPISLSQDAYQQVVTLEFQRDKLSKYLRPAHPKIIALDKEIAEEQNLLGFYSKQNQQDLDTDRRGLKIRMDGLQTAIDDWQAKVNFDSTRIAQDGSYKAAIARDQGMYERLSSLMDNVDITRNIDVDPLTILETASSSYRSYEKLKSNITMGCLGGLAAGLGIVLLLAKLDDRFASVVEVAERLGDNILGQVPEMRALHEGAKPLALMANGDGNHMYVESYRSLRSALLYFAVDGVRPRVLLITSAVPNEGKSTIASNLSCAMALGGARVLLIDADLRKGALHNLLGLQSKPGLAELLTNPGDLDKFIQASSMPNLSFIARGSGQKHPGDLFLSDAFSEMISRLRERFDYIIIDSSPVFAADDATTLAPQVDGTLLVVRSRFSRSGIVKEALDLLSQRQAVVLGMILNRTNAKERSYHYYKYSEYHTTGET